jgi:hypothetical protein
MSFTGTCLSPYKLAGSAVPSFSSLIQYSNRLNKHLSTMSTPTYPDEKQEPSYVDALDSDGPSSVNTITALIAEGERIHLIQHAKSMAVR